MKVRNVEDKNSPQVLFKSQLCWKHLSAEGTSKECAGSRYEIGRTGCSALLGSRVFFIASSILQGQQNWALYGCLEIWKTPEVFENALVSIQCLFSSSREVTQNYLLKLELYYVFRINFSHKLIQTEVKEVQYNASGYFLCLQRILLGAGSQLEKRICLGHRA